ncbi:MAG: helix-turn-helix transcriptional regulator [Pseudomonadota bacterium]
MNRLSDNRSRWHQIVIVEQIDVPGLREFMLGYLAATLVRLAARTGHYPSLIEMAADEHLSPRTLIRRLREEGSSYQHLLDSVREELACWLLIQTDLPVEAIAEQVGYADTSNFSRTFRRWLGLTPREFRLAGATRRRL